MRIAIVKLSALGDIIHTMIVLQFITDHYPESIIDWFVEESFKGVLENNPHINKIHTISFNKIKQEKSIRYLLEEILRLRKLEKYDLVIDIQNLIKSAIVSRVIPSDKTIGLDKNSSREGLASIFYTHKYAIAHAENIIKRNTTIVSKALNIKISRDDIINKEPFLYFDKCNFNLISGNKPNIILVPGASFASKIYPVKQYSEITKKIDANFIILWGNDSEKIIADQIKLSSSKVCIADKLSFNKLKSLLSQVDLVIGGDTGPVHMAWALNVPSITLFGSTPGYRNTYITNINRIIESSSDVNPYKIDKNDFSIKDIKVSDIVKISEHLLEFN